MMTMMTMMASDKEVGGGGGEGMATTKGIEDYLSLVMLLADRVKKAVKEAGSSENELWDVLNLVEELSDAIRKVFRRVASTQHPYDCPIRRILDEASKGLERALTVARRLRRAGFFRRVVTITTGTSDFKKASGLLEASVTDLYWLLSIFPSSEDDDRDEDDDGVCATLPPIAGTDPMLAYVWSCVAAVQMGCDASDRAEAAHNLANLALDNDRKKDIIIGEKGVPPLLALLKDSRSLEAQLAATLALSELATEKERVGILLAEQAVPVIVETLGKAPMRLQIKLARLISRMAFYNELAQEEFARENAIRPLVSLLTFEVPLDIPKPAPKKPTSIHTIVQINRDLAINSDGSGSGSSRGSSSSRDHVHQRKEKENETPETKLQLKIACAEALCSLCKVCVSNSRKITETKGLFCLSKLIEKEKGELQYNCLLTIFEITAVAETDADLRRSAFKMTSPAAKSVVDQLLRLVDQRSSPSLQIPAIMAIGSLARTFPARETRVLRPLVEQLGHWKPDVAAVTAQALAKFAGSENFLCEEHSKAIIEFGGVPLLMNLLRAGEKTQLPGLILLCYLALHVGSNEALERAKTLNTLESAARTAVAQDSYLRELLPKAIYNLELYRVKTQRDRFTRTSSISRPLSTFN